MSDAARIDLADRVAALRDQILAGADAGEREPPGAEVFDAVVRAVRSPRRAASDLDRALHDAISRRLAWRDSELRVLSDAREVCRALLSSARRALDDPAEVMQVAQAVADAGGAAAHIVIRLVLERVARERAALLREEVGQERLVQAIERQREELARLEQALARAPDSGD